MADTWKIAVFLGVQFLLGRRGSFPYGLLAEFSLIKITLLVIVSDIIQALLLLNFFDFFSRKIPWLKKKIHKCDMEKQEVYTGKWWTKIKKWGTPGLVAVAALPYGGGALTSSILAVSANMNKKPAFFLIVAGCIIGSMIFYLGFSSMLP
jgi:uncharacterized membrane protein